MPTNNKTIPQIIPMIAMIGNSFDDEVVLLPTVYTIVFLKV